MERIRGGWANVPDNLKCKTDLSKMGLKSGGAAKAEVWNGHIWVQLFELDEAIPKRKASDKQLAALAKARETAYQNYLKANTCDECNEFVGTENIRKLDGERICDYCLDRKRMDSMRAQGEEWFRSWYEKDFVILDTETTDLEGEIVEIGIIDRNGTVIYEALVRPSEPIKEAAIEIHGITNEMVSEAPTWKEKWPEIKQHLEGKLILVYNAPFDMQMIRNSCVRHEVDPINVNAECVMEAYRLYAMSERWISLRKASDSWTDHRAVGDCLAVLHLLRKVWCSLGLMAQEGMTA